MSRISRRRLLNLCAGGAVVGLAGCSGGGDGDDEDGDAASSESVQLAQLAVTNFESQPHTVHAVFLDGEDPVYWRSEAVAAAEEGVPQEAVLDGYPGNPSDHVLHVRLDDQSPSDWKRFDFAEAGADCLGINLRIGDFEGGGGEGELTVWTTNDPGNCEG